VFTVIEEQPQYPGGELALEQFLKENLRYPEEAANLGIRGKVYVTFVVETDGTASDARVLRGIGGGCDEEALRVVTMMPRWNPGKMRGKPVRVQFNLPVHFIMGDRDGGSQGSGNPGNSGSANIAGNRIDRENEILRSGFQHSARLGWLNYDRLFAINGPKIDVAIQTDASEQVRVALVFQSARVFLTPAFLQNGVALFRQVPKNALVTLVASKREKDAMLVSRQDITLSETAVVKFNFVPVP
jgi:TonB family protein